jgi:hypothetical protein
MNIENIDTEDIFKFVDLKIQIILHIGWKINLMRQKLKDILQQQIEKVDIKEDLS